MLVGGLIAAALGPISAQAQVNINSLFGKSHPEVVKVLGTPTMTAGSPTNYARFTTSGAVDTQVWYFWNTGKVKSVRFDILATPGDSTNAVLKRYHVSIGSNPKKVQVKAPAMTASNNGPVPGIPWTNVTVSYMNGMSFEPGEVEYCKKHNLNLSKTWFYTVLVSTQPNRGHMMGAGSDGGGEAPHNGKGGKGKGGHKRG